MRLPIFQVSLSAEDDADASSAEADVDFAAVTGPMLFKPLRKSWVIPTHALQLKGAGHVVLFDTFDHCLTSGVCAGRLRLGRDRREAGVLVRAPTTEGQRGARPRRSVLGGPPRDCRSGRAPHLPSDTVW